MFVFCQKFGLKLQKNERKEEEKCLALYCKFFFHISTVRTRTKYWKRKKIQVLTEAVFAQVTNVL